MKDDLYELGLIFVLVIEVSIFYNVFIGSMFLVFLRV